MESTDRVNRNDLGASQMIVQQYARYPSTLETALQSASSLGSARSQVDVHRSPSLHPRETPRSMQSSPKGTRSAIPPSTARSGPSMSPPLFEAMRQHQMKDTTDQVESRQLPSRDVTDVTIDDAYVLFILYCNPNVPSSDDTSELRKAFRCPPRSDGKSFSIFTLFELIRKLNNKELKTWIQLAIELGVEPPSMEKKQSTQKVQQYAVRLKRWMRAMHVDAFFEYCMGNPHAYYTQLPPSGSFVSEPRDGVPLEEDLALRALVPQWKPKRGRKRVEERDLDEGKAAKRPLLDTSVGALYHGGSHDHSVTFPQSAIPFSAHPDTEGHDPWMTASSAFPPTASDRQGQDLRWRLPPRDTSPANYPQSAIIPRGTQSSADLMSAEPQSAVTPVSGEKSRARRKHGPAVSSAWPSSNGSATGKGRGRPPNKSSAGAFSTFLLSTKRESPQLRPTPAFRSCSLAGSQNSPNVTQQSPTPVSSGRPSKLQLQVPWHSGAPVRLATPPTLLVNGVNDATPVQAEKPQEAPQSVNAGREDHPVAGLGAQMNVDHLVRSLSSELLQAPVSGRTARLNPEEAQALASAMVVKLAALYSQLPHGLPPSFMAFHLGVGHHFGLTTPNGTFMTVNVDSAPNANKACRGPERDAVNSGPQYTVHVEYKAACQFSMKVVLEEPSPGVTPAGAVKKTPTSTDTQPETSANGNIAEADIEEDDLGHPVSEAVWEQRYLKLRAQMQKKEQALSQYKRKIMESVMADL